MKRIDKYFLSIFFLVIIFAACKKNNPAAVDGPFVVKLYNCNGDKNSASPYICFDSLINDSRCPINAYSNCITAGYALIKVSFNENGNTHVFKMSMPARISGGVNDTTINGYHLVFKTLDPYPSITSGPISSDDIKATIQINR